jgi:DNA relaxase NicK
VDLALLQSFSYIAGALGVCVAAFYYAFNLRETSRNRKIAYTTSFMQQFYSKEVGRRYIDLNQMSWSNHDEYMKKYDSRVNPENFADRWSFLGIRARAAALD